MVEYENLPGDVTLLSPGLGWHKIERGFQVDKKRNAYDVLVEKALRGQPSICIYRSFDGILGKMDTGLDLISDREPESYVKNENVLVFVILLWSWRLLWSPACFVVLPLFVIYFYAKLALLLTILNHQYTNSRL